MAKKRTPAPTLAADPHHFDFDLDRGIRYQVVEKLEASPLLPLTRGVGPALSGIYALYFKGKLVYIGKASKGTTKSKRTLRSRLSEHVGKIETRQNITLTEMMPLFEHRPLRRNAHHIGLGETVALHSQHARHKPRRYPPPIPAALAQYLPSTYLQPDRHQTSLTEAAKRAAMPKAVSTATMSGKRLRTKG